MHSPIGVGALRRAHTYTSHSDPLPRPWLARLFCCHACLPACRHRKLPQQTSPMHSLHSTCLDLIEVSEY